MNKRRFNQFFSVILAVVAVLMTSLFVQPIHRFVDNRPLSLFCFVMAVACIIWLFLRVNVGAMMQWMRPLKDALLDKRGQDVAEYAVMLAVILVIVVGTIRVLGKNANNVFSSVSSSIENKE